MTPLFRKILGMNWVLVLTMYGLLFVGVYAIESAARHLPAPDGMTGGEFFAGRHKTWMAIGTVVYFFLSIGGLSLGSLVGPSDVSRRACSNIQGDGS